MFIGRKKELENLKSYWSKMSAKEGQFVILYGRRRVGKTELVKEFMKDKDHSYFWLPKLMLTINCKISRGGFLLI